MLKSYYPHHTALRFPFLLELRFYFLLDKGQQDNLLTPPQNEFLGHIFQ